jgi:hypothetical protein
MTKHIGERMREIMAELRTKHGDAVLDDVINLTPFIKQVFEHELKANAPELNEFELETAIDELREVWFIKSVVDAWMGGDMLPMWDDTDHVFKFSQAQFAIPDDIKQRRLWCFANQYEVHDNPLTVDEREMWKKIAEEDRGGDSSEDTDNHV